MRGEAFGLAPGRWENTTACPDCRADVELSQTHPGLYTLTVRHDGTCPWYTAHKRKATT